MQYILPFAFNHHYRVSCSILSAHNLRVTRVCTQFMIYMQQDVYCNSTCFKRRELEINPRSDSTFISPQFFL